MNRQLSIIQEEKEKNQTKSKKVLKQGKSVQIEISNAKNLITKESGNLKLEPEERLTPNLRTHSNLQKFSSFQKKLPPKKKTICIEDGIFKMEEENVNLGTSSTPNKKFSSDKMVFKIDKNENINRNEERRRSSADTNKMSLSKFNKEIVSQSVKKDLTLEQVVKDINKPYLTYNKNGKINTFHKIKTFIDTVNINNKNTKKDEPISKSSQESGSSSIGKLAPLKPKSSILKKGNGKRKKSDQSVSFKEVMESSSPFKAKHNNNPEGMYSNKFRRSGRTILDIVSHKSKWRKFHNVFNVVSWIVYLKIEICKFGVSPRISTRVCNDSELDSNLNISEDFNNINTNSNLSQNKHTQDEYKKILKRNSSIYKPLFLIHPHNKCLKYWNILILVIMLYTVVVMPVRLAYTDDYLNSHYTIFYFDLVLEFIFFFDIIRTLVTTYFNEEGILVTSVASIFLNYLNGWFLVDLISVFPFYLIENSMQLDEGIGSNSGIFFLFRLPKLYRLIRLVRFVKITKILNSSSFLQKFESIFNLNSGFLKLFTFFITIAITSHIFSCVWYYMAKLDNFNPDTWVARNNWVDDDLASLYLKSLYFSFTSFLTIGYGDIVAFSNTEIILTCLWLYAGGIYYSFSISNISTVFSKYNAKLIDTNKKCMVVAEISKNNNFKRSLFETIKSHLYRSSKQDDNTHDYKKILNELPTNLKYQIANSIYEKAALELPVFKNRNKNFIANIIPLLKLKFFKKDEIIYNYDDVPENVYFILEGTVVFLTVDKIIYAKMNPGTYFGEIEILKRTYRDSTALTESDTQCLVLNKNILLEDITQQHNDFFNEFVENMIKRYNFNEKVKNMIENIIQEGVVIVYKNINNYKDVSSFSKMTNKDFFDVGIKGRANNNYIPNPYIQISLSENTHNGEISKSQIELELFKRRTTERRKSKFYTRKISFEKLEENNDILPQENKNLFMTQEANFSIENKKKKVVSLKIIRPDIRDEISKIKFENKNLFAFMQQVMKKLNFIQEKLVSKATVETGSINNIKSPERKKINKNYSKMKTINYHNTTSRKYLEIPEGTTYNINQRIIINSGSPIQDFNNLNIPNIDLKINNIKVIRELCELNVPK